MKIKTWLAAAGLACSLSANVQAGSTLSGSADIQVLNTNVPAPSLCSICGGGNGCRPGNMRSSGGWAYLHTLTNNGASVHVNQFFGGYGRNYNWGSPTSQTDSAVGGGEVNFYHDINSSSWWGYYYFTGSCTNAGGTVDGGAWENVVSCFLKDTPILMADGTYKMIQDVKVGDQVLSYDPETGRFLPSGVVNTVQASTEKYFVINGELKITPAHQLYANGQWVNSETLKVGDTLIGEDGKPVIITSIEEKNESVPVYNLVTTAPHDFFASGFLVHNVNPGEEHKDHGFGRGTKIALADGRVLPIERVKVGDKLISYDPQKRRYAFSTVTGAGKQTVGKTKLINGSLRVALKQPMFGAPKGK